VLYGLITDFVNLHWDLVTHASTCNIAYHFPNACETISMHTLRRVLKSYIMSLKWFIKSYHVLEMVY
jgi:hypothetical protein